VIVNPMIVEDQLDTWHPDLPGGTGKSFDWSVAKGLASDFPIILAGGLNVDNVQDAMETVSPWGMDVSSGLEDAPGRKNFDLVTKFFDLISENDPNL
ncbi:MAG: phosphoribosylanthranilate isomerase, partial [Bacteroidetes bacterium]|nr:phosphoribosylanthranilate isomerase [Bacteroidota bacterium]